MARKPYSPVASYDDLRRVEQTLAQATEVSQIRKLVQQDGPKIGYKAFCYLLGGRMSAAGMKPDDACAEADNLYAGGDSEAARALYEAVLAVHTDHAGAKEGLKNLAA